MARYVNEAFCSVLSRSLASIAYTCLASAVQGNKRGEDKEMEGRLDEHRRVLSSGAGSLSSGPLQSLPTVDFQTREEARVNPLHKTYKFQFLRPVHPVLPLRMSQAA